MAELLKKDEMKPGAVGEGGSMSKLYTGSWRTYVPLVDMEKCVQCLACWIACPDSAIKVEDGERQETDLQYCKGCGICATECPVDAIEMKRESELSEDEKKGLTSDG
ncbi:MAG: 4Fe-4S binding protein [Candidatus Brocadiaceae bacterium]|jgi:pyruvate ferredoxin oxidoreductase delta subunit